MNMQIKNCKIHKIVSYLRQYWFSCIEHMFLLFIYIILLVIAYFHLVAVKILSYCFYYCWSNWIGYQGPCRKGTNFDDTNSRMPEWHSQFQENNQCVVIYASVNVSHQESRNFLSPFQNHCRFPFIAKQSNFCLKVGPHHTCRENDLPLNLWATKTSWLQLLPDGD